jgi:hypothetical protein
VAYALDPKPTCSDGTHQRSIWQVNEVSRQIEREPATPEQPRLPAGAVWDRDYQQPRRSEQAAGPVQRGPRLAQVLERMPENDRRPFLRAFVEVDKLRRADIEARVRRQIASL